jgi:Secretion system C-terminal sorting domain
MLRIALVAVIFFYPYCSYSQVVLNADGPGNTYELISSVLAPGADAVENPECIHPQFGRHIAEVWDDDLKCYVFEFYSHVTPDNDRCVAFDRERIEIKTYEASPDYLKGVVGETITYKWKFKLPVGFQPSSSFTHIHQIKAVGGDDGNPLFTLTPRKGSPNKLELIHDNTTKVAIVNLSLFEGVWVSCTEVVKVGAAGTYSMTIKKVSDSTTILSYSNNSIMTIRPDNSFIRPKWGIYRSLDHPTDLRDEAVRFNAISIQEGTTTGVDRSEPSLPQHMHLEQNYPNPFNPSTMISYQIPGVSHIRVAIYDCLGKVMDVLVDKIQNGGRYQVPWDGAQYPGGVYFCRLQTKEYVETKKLLILK